MGLFTFWQFLGVVAILGILLIFGIYTYQTFFCRKKPPPKYLYGKPCGSFSVTNCNDAPILDPRHAAELQTVVGDTTAGFQVVYDGKNCPCIDPNTGAPGRVKIVQAIDPPTLSPFFDVGPNGGTGDWPGYTESWAPGLFTDNDYKDSPYYGGGHVFGSEWKVTACAVCQTSAGSDVLGCVNFVWHSSDPVQRLPGWLQAEIDGPAVGAGDAWRSAESYDPSHIGKPGL